MSKKTLITMAVFLSIILMSETSIAESSNKSKSIRAEVSLLFGVLHKRTYASGIDEFLYHTDFSGMLIGGIFLGNVGFEASFFNIPDYWLNPGGLSIYSANISLNIPFSKRFSLFITAGVGRSRYDTDSNIGGGLKIKLKDKWSIRVEYRDWRTLFNEGWHRGSSILGGVSWFF